MDAMEKLLEDYEKKLSYIYARANTKSKRKRIVDELFNFSYMCYEYFGIEKTFEWENDTDMILLFDSRIISFVQNITKNCEVYNEIFTSVLDTIINSGYSVYDYLNNNYMRITKKELNDLIFDFLNNYDDELLDNFKQKLRNDELFYTNSYRTKGSTYSMPDLNKNLIFYTMDDYYNIETASIIVHELGHDYEMKKHYKTGKRNYFEAVYGKPYYEIITKFLEYAFVNYLVENNIYKQDSNKWIHTHIYALLFRTYKVCLLYKMNEINIDEDGKVVINEDTVCRYANEIQNKINCYVFPSEKGDIINCRQAFIYGIGDLFSFYLYENYKQDPNNFKKEFLNALLASPYVDDISPFERVGITPDVLIKGDVLKKVLKNNK